MACTAGSKINTHRIYRSRKKLHFDVYLKIIRSSDNHKFPIFQNIRKQNNIQLNCIPIVIIIKHWHSTIVLHTYIISKWLRSVGRGGADGVSGETFVVSETGGGTALELLPPGPNFPSGPISPPATGWRDVNYDIQNRQCQRRLRQRRRRNNRTERTDSSCVNVDMTWTWKASLAKRLRIQTHVNRTTRKRRD